MHKLYTAHFENNVARFVLTNESKDVFDCIRKMIAASRFFALEYPQLNQIYLDIYPKYIR